VRLELDLENKTLRFLCSLSCVLSFPQFAFCSPKNQSTMGDVSISIIIRPARLREYKAAGSIAAETYFPTALTAFLSPGRIEYYSHYERSFQKMALSRMLDPATRSLPASPTGRRGPLGASTSSAWAMTRGQRHMSGRRRACSSGLAGGWLGRGFS
jgi:hypothetical protein